LKINGNEKYWNPNDSLSNAMTQSYDDFINQTVYQEIKYQLDRQVSTEQVNEIKRDFLLNGKMIKLNRAFAEIKALEAKKLGFNKDLDLCDTNDLNNKRLQLDKQGISKYYSAFQRLLCANGFHSFFFDVAEFSENEVDYIIKNCLYDQRYSNIPKSEMDLYIVSSLVISMLIQEYRKVRELYLNKSKEDLFFSLKNQRDELGKREHSLEMKDKLLTEEISRLNDTNEKLINENEDLNLKNKRLVLELKERQNNDKELLSLREMLFKLDNAVVPDIDSLNIDEMIKGLSQEKLVFISGQISLVNKLKDLLPTARFLDIDKLGTNLSFLDNYSIVYVDVSHLSHSYYYKLTAQMNKNSARLIFITRKTNIYLLIKEMYESIYVK